MDLSDPTGYEPQVVTIEGVMHGQHVVVTAAWAKNYSGGKTRATLEQNLLSQLHNRVI